MKLDKYEGHAGMTLEMVCEEMSERAPCESEVNGVYMVALPGVTPSELLTRLRDALARDHKKEMDQIKMTARHIAYERGTCAGEITRALVMLRAGDLATAESLMVAEIKRLTG